ncbi:hypothetical protein GMLC_07360 [Geomonas limicola]|uniref:Zinc/iron-chelating domain-containing protein n=1 Tax=Geomonas limicola TaxID=2740186 RepID=A0A6V8N5Q6_9BACT|nr:YkgJ family cysteine cluster protein [Geomonas limicola]GFO67157.1 hypothetical protein GMLC_07360 [Geomonas limicola]
MSASSGPIEQLLELVKEQQAFLEMFARSWVSDYRANDGSIFCAKGCRNCCSLAVHTGFAEALAIASSLSDELKQAVSRYAAKLKGVVGSVRELPDYLRLHRGEMGFCPLLDPSGACSVYPVRPLTCRSLISTKESCWCGTDFATLPAAERESYLASLDRQVVSYPSHYIAVLQDTAQELEAVETRRMRDLFGFSLYGNLGVLLELICQHRLAEACLDGRSSAEAVIDAAGFQHPLLLTLA